MKHYLIADLTVTDDAWVAGYLENVTRLVHEHGGRYLARTPKLERLEGDRPAPQLIVVLELPSREAAIALYESADYAPYREARQAGSTGSMFLVAGEDMASAAAG